MLLQVVLEEGEMKAAIADDINAYCSSATDLCCDVVGIRYIASQFSEVMWMDNANKS